MSLDNRSVLRRARWLPIAACFLSGGFVHAGSPEFFEMRIRPVLAKNCYACHTSTHMGGLELDTREHVLKGGQSGPAIQPGDPDHSLLIQAVRHTHERIKMPPGGKLKDEEIADLAQWVKDGAVWGSSVAPIKSAEYVITPEQRAFWAFRPVRAYPPPPVKDAAWAKTPIDHFVLAKLETEGLRPAQAAGKRELIRRVTYDLTGLPPSPEEVEGFVNDRSPQAFAKVVDRLLASPHYGERWGRFWLDVARYSDDKLDSERENPYPNAFRYRNWVIQAFNDDMPYDQFVKAQIAGDLMPAADRAKYEPGLGFYALSPEFQDDRVDATTRGFLALTVACATCHNHKYDPIPQKDYYSLLGVFTSTEPYEYPLAPAAQVEAFKAQQKKIDDQKAAISDLIKTQSTALAGVLAARTAEYLRAAAGQEPKAKLDQETLERWKKYLARADREHPFLNDWQHQDFDKFQALLLSIDADKKRIDDENHVRLGLNPTREQLAGANLVSLARDKFVLWRDVFGEKSGVLHYADKDIDRFLSPIFEERLNAMRENLAALEKALPPHYPYLHAIKDKEHVANEHVHIRGNADNLGDEVPRHFLSILSSGQPKPFSEGSGRLELAEDIASPDNPLTARVIVNRIWQHHFGQGLVRTPSNFGQLGDRPSHPELLDYLAARLVANHWSVKSLHREILLSNTYAMSTEFIAEDFAKDPDNRFLWHANRRRLDVEALRDSLLDVAGALDLAPGETLAKKLTDDNRQRTVYGFVSRRRIDGTLGLFDFPNPNSTSEQRINTNVPLQRLFFLNSDFILEQSKRLAERLQPLGDDQKRIDRAYELLFARKPTDPERKLGLEFLKDSAWPQYAQALLSSNEFSFLE
jgi:mono/diheme cytochrome c family protein